MSPSRKKYYWQPMSKARRHDLKALTASFTRLSDQDREFILSELLTRTLTKLEHFIQLEKLFRARPSLRAEFEPRLFWAGESVERILNLARGEQEGTE